MAIPDKAITRNEQYLSAMAGASGTLPDEPITRKEFYLAKAAGQAVETPEPITREEMYLDVIAESGGGGGGVTVNPLSVSENGIYTAPSGTAYSPITVNVSIPTPTLVTKTVTENGTFRAASDGADGFSAVTVNVPVVDVAMGTATAVGSAMVIPKVDGKTNFFAYVDADENYFSAGGMAMWAMRLSWLSSTNVYSSKANGTAFPPASLQTGTHPSPYVTETTSSVTVKFPNSNTVGSLPNGTTVRYLLW